MVPPYRPIHNVGDDGQLSMWGPKSPEFGQWRGLAAVGQVLVVETDASKLVGWSYRICHLARVVSGTWPEHFGDLAENAHAINFKELRVAKELVTREAAILRGWRVVIRMDNRAAVHYINIRYGMAMY